MTSLSLQIFQSRLPFKPGLQATDCLGSPQSIFFFFGRLRSLVQPLILLYYIIPFLDRRGIPSLDKINGTPFTCLVVKFASLLTTVNSFYFGFLNVNDLQYKTSAVSPFEPFYGTKWQISLQLHILKPVKFLTLLYT